MAYYYIDYTNGNDARTGLRIPAGDQDSTSYYQIDSSADTTHFVDSALGGYATSALIGSFFYNVTRTAGALITANTTGTGAVTIGTAIPSMAASDNYYILDSYKAVQTYTNSGSRAAGDKAYMRANMTHTQGAANITLANSGTTAGVISLIGCNATQAIDPWHDASDTKPIIDFNNGAYYLYHNRNFWYYKNLDVRYSNIASYLFRIYQCSNTILENVNIRDAANASAIGLYINTCSDIKLYNCEIYNNVSMNVYLDRTASSILKNCTIKGGANAPTVGLSFAMTERVYIQNTVFGGGGATHSTCDIRAYAGSASGVIITKNCTFNSTKTTATDSAFNSLLVEEDTTTFGNQTVTSTIGVVQKCAVTLTDTTVRSGGGSSSARMIPNAYTGPNRFLTIAGDLWTPDFKIWCPASSTTITIYIRAYGTWSVYPTASELWIEAEYYSDDSPVTKVSSTASTQVISDTTTWVAFTTTFTPHAAGFAYVKVQLGKYQDASTGVYVDVLPVVS